MYRAKYETNRPRSWETTNINWNELKEQIKEQLNPSIYAQASPEERKLRSPIDITDDITWGKKRIQQLQDELEYMIERVHGDMMYLDCIKLRQNMPETDICDEPENLFSYNGF